MPSEPVRERAAGGRLGLVIARLADALRDSARAGGGAPPLLLDCGGGSGTFAVPLAKHGADVTVVDISADALATLSRRAAEAGVADLVHPVQGDAESLGELVAAGSFDLVMAHGILEAVDDVGTAFAGIAAAVRINGLVSVLVGNPVAAVLARALAGEPAAALAELRDLDRKVGPDTVRRLCADAGLVVESRRGVGVFSDLVPGAAFDAPGALDDLDELDAAAADRAPFADIAARVHLLARRAG